MMRSNYIARIAELSESEGVFTTAQAERVGIPRDALHDAAEAGRVERVMRGAYRMVGSGTSYLDELAAIWKLTVPARFSHERMRASEWDGVAIGGHTAASLLGIGDLHLSPYRFFSPERFNTRNKSAHFTKRVISRDEVVFVQGLPVTRPERTIFDLIVDYEDPSLRADVLRDAVRANSNFDFRELEGLLKQKYSNRVAGEIYNGLLVDAGVADGEGDVDGVQKCTSSRNGS